MRRRRAIADLKAANPVPRPNPPKRLGALGANPLLFAASTEAAADAARPRRRRAAGLAVAVGAAAVAALALAVVGPGIRQSSDRGAGSPSAGSPASATADEAPAAKQWMERPDLPFDYYWDLFDQAQLRDQEIAQAEGGDWEVAQEEFTDNCMAAEGYEYYPREIEPNSQGGWNAVALGDRKLWVPWLPDDLAGVERHGYGRLTGEIVYQVDPEAADAAQAAAADPNREYADSLDAWARGEYQSALSRCAAEADAAHPYVLPEVLENSPLNAYRQLTDQMSDLAGDAYSPTFLFRAEVDALDAAWQECFERDFPLDEPAQGAAIGDSDAATPGGASREAERSDQPAQGTAGEGSDAASSATSATSADWPSGGPAVAWRLALGTGPEGDRWTGATDQAPVEYRSLTGAPGEVAIAVADYQCRAETDYVDRLLALETAAQDQFIADHQAELDELTAALRTYVNG